MICKNCHTSYNYLTKLGGKLKKKKNLYSIYDSVQIPTCIGTCINVMNVYKFLCFVVRTFCGCCGLCSFILVSLEFAAAYDRMQWV